ncbi:MAG TPA: amine dehydrogenase large subunit [Woeseiaceae bacterium]|nr:amine dehydrogenase large subunit [Woeseiaceae bacterium]
MTIRIIASLAFGLFLALPAAAEVPLETPHVATLGEPAPHWFWADDVAFFNMADGRAYLYDADSGRMLGMLSTGIFYAKFETPDDYSIIYSPESYYSRHTRGERTDVITYYDTRTLEVVDETIIPPRRHSGVPNIGFSALTDNERFLTVYNFSPAQSVSVVDVETREFVGELATPGCALTYAAGERSFFMMCGDGSLLTIALDEAGKEASREKSEPFFDPAADPVMEKPVRRGDTWYFVSFEGNIHEVDVSQDAPAFAEPWPLAGEGQAGWRPGGSQLLAIHPERNELAVLMHEGGGPGSHKNPGTEIWVYDLENRERVRRIELAAPAVAINVTRDANPVLVASHGGPVIDVYDFASGEHLRTIEGVGQTPLYLQVMP